MQECKSLNLCATTKLFNNLYLFYDDYQIFRRSLLIIVVYEYVLYRKSDDFAKIDKIEFHGMIEHF